MSKPRLKLDENLDVRAARILRDAGYDAVTVAAEALGGSRDQTIARTCQREGRCLLTLDLHFSNILDVPPGSYPGIIVLWHRRLRLRAVLSLVRNVVVALESHDPSGELWIVEPSRIRMLTGRQ